MRKSSRDNTGTMLDLWRPPQHAGDPIGCLATTFTFDPGFFDEQCLARFLEIDSEPNREDLAFLLERETRLGGVYAGILVDYTQAGVDHSLRWDVLPVRIPRGKQHAKISLLAWTRRVRIIVASANLTEYGYRYNFEVAGSIDATPADGEADSLHSCCEFLRSLLGFVPGAAPDVPEIRRAVGFLDQVESHCESWASRKPKSALRQYLVFNRPALDRNPATGGAGPTRAETLGETIATCRRSGGSPASVWVASPFFDPAGSGDLRDDVTAELCKSDGEGPGAGPDAVRPDDWRAVGAPSACRSHQSPAHRRAIRRRCQHRVSSPPGPGQKRPAVACEDDSAVHGGLQCGPDWIVQLHEGWARHRSSH